jgi:group I intron endonuclease
MVLSMPYKNPTNAIYRIVNQQTGVCYVGQSQNVQKRLKEHMRLLRWNKHDNIHLQRAYNLYGGDVFCADMEIVCEFVDDLDGIEEAFLSGEAYFDTPCIYNIASFAKAPMRGKTHNAEVRKKISEGRKKTTFNYQSKSYRATLSEAQKKRLLSDPIFVAKIRFLVNNEGMSYAERGRVLGIATSNARKLALKYTYLKGEFLC